jgi:hypothetical protein
LKFLQKAALSLREPYYLKAPSAKLSGKDRVSIDQQLHPRLRSMVWSPFWSILTKLRRKNGDFLVNQCHEIFLQKAAVFWVKAAKILTPFFRRKRLNNHNIGP